MSRLTVLGRLTAAEDRTLKGLLLPYGVPGYTNHGRVLASRGCVEIPEDPAPLPCSLDHDDGLDPVAEFASVTETDDGLVAEWTVRKTHGGDKLLAEYKAGKRTGISVELEPVTVVAGKIVAGRLDGCAFPEKPAFDTARLAAAYVAQDEDGALRADFDTSSTGESVDTYVDEDGNTVTVTTRREARETSTTDTEGTEPEDEEEETDVPAASAPQDLKASAAKRGTGKPADKAPTLQDAFRLIAEAYNTQDPSRLTAALADVVIGTAANGIQSRTTQPTWLGELWSGKAYQRRYVPLMSKGTLTGMKVAGWRWTTKPVMADYAGDKAAVPSNTVAVEAAEAVAQRCAGGWDIDRAFFDFGNTAFIESFFRALTESYAKLSDARALAALVAAATANPTVAGAVPTGVSPAMAAIVDGALAIIEEGTPAYALVAPDLYRDVLLTRNDDTLAYLNAALGLEDGTIAAFRIQPAALPAGQVAVGAREAVTFYELGETPIRVEAENIANGGRDVGVFGYTSSIVNDGDAITLVDTDPAV